jgi:actin-related protein
MDIELGKEEQDLQEEKQEEKRKYTKREKENSRSLGIGLDVGTMTVISSIFNNGKISYKMQRDAFFDIENNMMSKNMLNKLKANYIEGSDKKYLYVIGEEALQMANFFNREIRRPLSKGVISTHEKEALSMIKIILHSIVGDPLEKNEVCYYSVPAMPIDADYNVVYHDNILKSFLTSFGFDARPLNEAFAVCWAELEDEGFTGLSLSFGAGMVNVALSFMGISQDEHQFSIARSGDWIDENSASAVGLTASRMTAIKESGVDIKNPQGREQEAIKIYYENLIRYTCNKLEKYIASAKNVPNFPEPISVVVSGGTSKVKNFEVLFEEELKAKSLPFKIKNVKKASDQLNAVSRGCLLNALNSYS